MTLRAHLALLAVAVVGALVAVLLAGPSRGPVWLIAGVGVLVLAAGSFLVFRDASGRKQAEATLQETTQLIQALVESSGLGLVVLDTEARVRLWNPAAERIFGWTAAEAVGRPLPVVPTEDRAEFRANFDVALAGRLFSGEVRWRRKDGSPVDLAVTSTALRDAAGHVDGVVTIVADVTARKREQAEQEALRQRVLEMEQRQREEAAHLYREAERRRREAEVVAGLARRLGAAADVAHVLQLVVEGARELTGSDLAHIALQDPRSGAMVFRFWAGNRKGGTQGYEVTPGKGIGGQVLLTGRPFRTDHYAADPRISPDFLSTIAAEGIVASMAVPIRIDGVVEGLLFVDNRAPRPFTDRDETLLSRLADHAAMAIRSVRLLASTEEARAEAEAANRAKDEFLAMLGHELRNPLSAIANALLVLERIGKPDERCLRLRAIIGRQIRHLARLVDDLLDVTRLQTGKIQLQRAPTDLRTVAQRGLASLHQAGKTAAHTVELAGDPVWVDGDATRLEQVVWNLLDNAVKYTPAGGRILMRVGQEADDAVLRVRDTGAGIPPEMLPRIFDLFVQGNASLDRSKGGLGLGLSLVHRLVELHGGRVEAHSDGAGRGSEFVIRVPALMAAVAPAVGPAPPAAPAVARHVLLVEDNDDVRDGLRLLLEDWGHRVDEAPDGKIGLQRALECRPDVMLVDLGLPGLDGYALARRIRAAPGTTGTVLVALTGYGQPEDRRRALEAGFDAHLVKPVEPDELARLLGVSRVRRD